MKNFELYINLFFLFEHPSILLLPVEATRTFDIVD